MNRRQHAALARELIRACGGLDEATRNQRLGRSRLAECQDPGARAWMPADVINELELYCGSNLYSRAMAEERPTASHPSDDLMEAACETAEEAVDLQRLARLMRAHAAGQLSPRQRGELVGEAMKLRRTLETLIATADAAEGG